MTILGKRFALPIIPSVNPSEDSTALDTIYFTKSDKVRFQDGKLRKIKGWSRVFSQNSQRIIGAARNIYSYRDADNHPITIIGTARSLYALFQGSVVFNITPLLTATNPIPNSFSTEYNLDDLVTVTTTMKSSTVTLDITQYLNSNEQITISGVTGTINGIPGTAFNKTFNAYVISNNQIQINVGVPASSSGTQVVTMTWATSYLYVTIDDYNMLTGDRIKILASGDVANIPADQINDETIISNTVNLDQFVIQTETIADALVLLQGGADTTIQYQIPAGNTDQSIGFGYGGGQYGEGEFGQADEFTDNATNSYPRVWSMDKWQDANGNVFLILTPGDTVGSADTTGANLYSWTNDITVAPTLIASAPFFIRWCYVSHNAICTLGGAFPMASEGIPNFFATSDIGDMNSWTPGPGNYAFFAILDQANALVSQASTRDRDLIFTEDEVYRVEFVNKPDIWFISKLFTTDGVMGPKARAEIEDAVLWMGKGDFFVFDGSSIDILPNNTLKRFVYDNLNDAQSSKCFAYANTQYNEVWFFYVAGQDIEPNNYAMYNYKDKNWTMGTLPRTASEEPLNISSTPYMMQSNITSTITPTSINSFFFTMGTDPFTTYDGTKTISFPVTTTCYLEVGDFLKITGSTDINGIPAAEINGIKQIVAINDSIAGGFGSGYYGFGLFGVSPSFQAQIEIESITTTSTSTGNGGGSSITVGTSIIGLDIASSRIDANELITLRSAPEVGGIPQNIVNVTNAAVRALVGTVIQINDAAPSTVFATSAQTIENTIAPAFFVNYTPSDRLFQQEVGLNDYNIDYVYGQPGSSPFAPMLSLAQTNMAQIGEGDETAVLYSVYPDTRQQGNLTLTVSGKLYAQSSTIFPSLGNTNGVYTITPQTTKVDLMFVARQRQYIIQSFELNGDFLIGKWFEEVKPSSTR